ncbi:hypothetical protein [Alicyclobacillus macrosporangiidus]|uniref:Yip1 domain-containing protein n=1 Tax=Alicyclobacillus macrosporangiidus TaxID=392015 RepID=A0A1I7JCC1_9BACL|nr:hypothetical protein [Alicyclobacillus macrosporangiidus]SFU82808.1 hypothetical protein SAMN05421543_109101 [Alicyclobacillus macrosporangiidus]
MHTDKDFRADWAGYWCTLGRLLRGTRVLHQQLDIPLEQGIRRSRWTALWVAALGVAAGLIACPDAWAALRQALRLPAEGWAFMATSAAWVALTALIAVALYGFLRLYTLVTHVIATNVFKTRGQRLRLLNVECTALTLTAPVSAGVALTHWSVWGGALISSAFALYAAWVMGLGYAAVFHKRPLSGLGLWLVTSAVSGFVLLIGALAVAVTAGVLSLFFLVVLRLFVHRGQ